MSNQVSKTEILLAGASTLEGAVGRYVEVANCDFLTVTTVVNVSANTLVASVAIGGSNDDPLVSSFPILSNGILITVAPTGWTFTPETGLLTAASPAIGTYEMTVSYARFPRWIKAFYDYTSGGGTVDAKVIATAWSV